MTRPESHEVFPYCSRAALCLLLLDLIRSRTSAQAQPAFALRHGSSQPTPPGARARLKA